MYTCMHSAHAYTHWSCWPGCKGEHTHTQAGVQGGTYTHTGLAGRGARENIHTHRPGCKGEQGNIRKTRRTGVKVYSISKNVGM